MNGDEFGVYYRPELVAARVRSTRFALLWRIGWTLLIVGLAVAGWFAFPEQFGPSASWMIWSSAVVGGSLAIYQLVVFLRARGEAKVVAAPLALGANRDGILVGDHWFPRPEIGSLIVRPGRLGSSAALVATGREGGDRRVLIDYTDVMPASLDSAVMALSGGRARVDLSYLDT